MSFGVDKKKDHRSLCFKKCSTRMSGCISRRCFMDDMFLSRNVSNKKNPVRNSVLFHQDNVLLLIGWPMRFLHDDNVKVIPRVSYSTDHAPITDFPTLNVEGHSPCGRCSSFPSLPYSTQFLASRSISQLVKQIPEESLTTTYGIMASKRFQKWLPNLYTGINILSFSFLVEKSFFFLFFSQKKNHLIALKYLRNSMDSMNILCICLLNKSELTSHNVCSLQLDSPRGNTSCPKH